MEELGQAASKPIVLMDSFGSTSGSKKDARGKKNSPADAAPAMAAADELEKEEHWPLSGKPYFHISFCKSYSQSVLLPAKILAVIPRGVFPTWIAYRGFKWKMECVTTGRQKKLCSGWGKFVADNNLGVGDICIFELLDHSMNGHLKFRSQILRNRLPDVILQRMKAQDERESSVIVLD